MPRSEADRARVNGLVQLARADLGGLIAAGYIPNDLTQRGTVHLGFAAGFPTLFRAVRSRLNFCGCGCGAWGPGSPEEMAEIYAVLRRVCTPHRLTARLEAPYVYLSRRMPPEDGPWLTRLAAWEASGGARNSPPRRSRASR